MLRQKVSRIDLLLWCVFIAGSLIGIIVQFAYHKFINNDTLSYINIAELYASGKFGLALNGCWSPLYSWIIAIFLLLGVPAIYTCYILNFFAAGMCLYFLMKISRRYLADNNFYVLFILFSIVWVLFKAISALTPDLLGAAAGLWMVGLLMSEDFFSSRRVAVKTGLAGAVMYFAKSYNFVFVTGLLLLLLVLSLMNKKQRSTGNYRSYLYSLGFFLLVSLAWITPLSIQQGNLTISTAGPYVHRFVHPDNREHPIAKRIIEPPYPEAYFAWIDPVNQLNGFEWSPFDNKRYFDHQVRLMKNGLHDWFYIIDVTYLKTILLISSLIFLFFRNREKLWSLFKDMKIPLIVVFSYPLGYLFYFVLERYIFLSEMMFHLFFFYVLQTAISQFKLRNMGLVMVALTLILYISFDRVANSFWKEKFFAYRTYNSLYVNLPELDFLKHKKIVTDRRCFINGVQISYRLQSKFYGVWSREQSDKVKQYGINYLLTVQDLSESGIEMVKTIRMHDKVLRVYRFSQ